MIKKIISVLVDILIILLVVVIIFNIAIISKDESKKLPSIFGYKFLVDLTDSMIPEIESGSLIIIREKDSYQVNEIIAYRNHSNAIITHRIIDIDTDSNEPSFVVKGDNNNTADDNPVKMSQIEGAYIKAIPKLGSICLFLTSIYGIIFLISLFVAYFIYRIIREKYFS